jgi:hypothetical protein
MKNLNLQELKEKAIKLFTAAGKVGLIIAAMFIGMITRDIYVRVMNAEKPVKNSTYHNPKTATEISVAVNDRGELMIIDRKNGSYTLYQDSVGQMIFRMYAAQIYIDKNK